MSLVQAAMDTPLATVVESLTSNRLLRAVFYSYCTLHGVEPRDASFGLHALVTDSLIRGPYALTHGGDSLVKKYVEVIQAQGGRVLTKKRVIAIENIGKLATAVVTADGERFEADWVIAGIHPKRAFELVSDPSVFSTAFRERLSKIQESVGIFGIYGTCSKGLDFDPLRNYYYFASQDPDRLTQVGEPLSKPGSVFVSTASRIPNESRSSMALNIHAASPIAWFDKWGDSAWSKRPAEYESTKAEFAERMFESVERYKPGFRQGIERFQTSSPLTNLHFNGSPEGSSYGLYHSIQNTGARSLGPRTHVANLLLTGQSCLFPGLLGERFRRSGRLGILWASNRS